MILFLEYSSGDYLLEFSNADFLPCFRSRARHRVKVAPLEWAGTSARVAVTVRDERHQIGRSIPIGPLSRISHPYQLP